jgi:conjugative transfer signal peptidase TraF
VTQRRIGIVLVASAGGIWALLAAVFSFSGYRFNLTPSFPMGLWRIVPMMREVQVGDTVFICPPAGAQTAFARERGYYMGGDCPSGVRPLIKTVLAKAGQHYDVGTDISIDGAPIPGSRVEPRDAEGRPMTSAGYGVVADGEVFLYSPKAGSYDSRYYGAIPAKGVMGLAEPVAVIGR